MTEKRNACGYTQITDTKTAERTGEKTQEEDKLKAKPTARWAALEMVTVSSGDSGSGITRPLSLTALKFNFSGPHAPTLTLRRTGRDKTTLRHTQDLKRQPGMAAADRPPARWLRIGIAAELRAIDGVARV